VGFVSAKTVSLYFFKVCPNAVKFDRYMEMTRTSIIIAARGDPRHTMGLSSLIHALHGTKQYAVARFVAKMNKAPLLLLLAPMIEDGYECLVDSELPFTEDIRSFKFPPLDKVVTVAGKHIFQHRTLPNDKLKEAVSHYVDSMDLSVAGKDNGYTSNFNRWQLLTALRASSEWAKMKDTYSPVVNRINQAIRYRATHPNTKLPTPYEVLTRYMQPPQEVSEASSKYLEALIAEADVKPGESNAGIFSPDDA
jgi:ATP-dependent DNA helicase 2 subunit 2